MPSQILLCDTNADKFVSRLLICALSTKEFVEQVNPHSGIR